MAALAGADHCRLEPLGVRGLPVGLRWAGRSVESDDDMEMDEASVLILDDLGVGDPRMIREVRASHTHRLRQLSSDTDGCATPQLGGVGVPQDGTGVVEAVRAERFAQPVVV